VSVHEDLDKRDLRYNKFAFGRAQGWEDAKIVEELDDPDIDFPQVLYRRLSHDDYPVCPECGMAPVPRKHCERSKRQRKARRGTDARTELPRAAEAIPLFDPLVATLGDYVLDVTTLRETYANERFEAVERYELSAIIDAAENTTTYGPATLPLGARQSPPHALVALIAA